MKNFLIKSVLSIALLLIPSSALAQSSPVPEGQTSFSDYVQTVGECSEAFQTGLTTEVQTCLDTLDSLIPQSCYAVSWATYRTLVFLALESRTTGNSALNGAIEFLIQDFIEKAGSVGVACQPYTVNENEN